MNIDHILSPFQLLSAPSCFLPTLFHVLFFFYLKKKTKLDSKPNKRQNPAGNNIMEKEVMNLR